jgi:hypothetical protein
MDLREIGWGGMDWIDLAQDKGMCLGLLRIILKVIKIVSVPAENRTGYLPNTNQKCCAYIIIQ